MVRNIIYAVIFAAIVTVSWQIGSILLEKKDVTFLLESHANNIKKFDYYDGMIQKEMTIDLKKEGLPTEFTVEILEKRKVRISYQFNRIASIFGYPYYQVNETITAETK
ncbi:MAG: hypothetical protein V2B20_13020 [Pseudomonadota bacterium]